MQISMIFCPRNRKTGMSWPNLAMRDLRYYIIYGETNPRREVDILEAMTFSLLVCLVLMLPLGILAEEYGEPIHEVIFAVEVKCVVNTINSY